MYRVHNARIDDEATAYMVEAEIIHRLREVRGRTFNFLVNKNKDSRKKYPHYPEIGKITAGVRKIIGLTVDVPPGLRESIIA
jgi:hypothetical protein